MNAQPENLRSVAVAAITVDLDIQQRASHVDPVLVEDYATEMQAGAAFPPVVAFTDGSDVWLCDGFHRIAAAKLAKLGEIEVDLRDGTRREAILYATGANATHGVRRSNADKRKAVETLLRDSEWSTWSDRTIAQVARVSDHLVGEVRSELNATANSRSQPPGPAPQRRMGRDGRCIDTSNIGKKPAPKPSVQTKLSDVQRVFNQFGSVCRELRDVEARLAPTEVFKICALARDTLRHFLPRLNPKDREQFIAKITGEGAADA